MSLLARVLDRLKGDNSDNEEQSVSFNSTAIARARFNPRNKHLYIQYTSSPTEYVFKANKKTWNDLLNSWSKGKFTHYILKRHNQAPRRWY